LCVKGRAGTSCWGSEDCGILGRSGLVWSSTRERANESCALMRECLFQKKWQRCPFVPHLGFDVRDRDLAGIPSLCKNLYRKGACSEGAEVLRIDPEFSLERFTRLRPYYQSGKDSITDSLARRGWGEIRICAISKRGGRTLFARSAKSYTDGVPNLPLNLKRMPLRFPPNIRLPWCLLYLLLCCELT
jgi:hypothetical protein